MSGAASLDIAPAAWAKFDPRLRRAVEALLGDPTIELPVMVVLAGVQEPTRAAEPPADREARRRQAQERQAGFERETADLVQKLEQLGAREIQRFWINRTVGARLTLPAMEAVGKREEVREIVLAVRQKVVAKTTS